MNKNAKLQLNIYRAFPTGIPDDCLCLLKYLQCSLLLIYLLRQTMAKGKNQRQKSCVQRCNFHKNSLFWQKICFTSSINQDHHTNMKTRTCPNCGYRYTWKEHLKITSFKNRWKCKNCGAKLTYNMNRRVNLSLIASFSMVFFAYFLTSTISEHLHISFWIAIPISLVILMGWWGYIFSYEKYEISKRQ